MIDTDKYEGHNYNWYVKYHNTGKHEVRVDGKNEVEDDHVCYLQYHPAFKDVQAKNAKLIADAPLLLEHVKCLTKTLELIGKNMPYDSWMHTLIKDVIGFEKWQAKEMKRND